MKSKMELPMCELPLPLERDLFLRSLLRELAGSLEEVVGLNEAAGFISVVGQRIGLEFNRDYTTALGVSQLTRQQVAAVLVDLKDYPMPIYNGDEEAETGPPERASASA